MARVLRRCVRKPCHARFVGGAGCTLRGEVCDVSLEGARLRLDSPEGHHSLEAGALSLKEEVFLEFELPHGHVEVVAEVVRLARSPDHRVEVGLRFVRLPAPSMRVLAKTFEPEAPWRSRFWRTWVFVSV